MAGRYLGIEPIILKDGRIIKTGEIIQEMPEKEARVRKGFEPVTEIKKESKKKFKESDNE